MSDVREEAAYTKGFIDGKREQADRLERLQAQVDAVREACDRIVLPWQETGEPTGEHLRDAAAMIRAALDGDDDG